MTTRRSFMGQLAAVPLAGAAPASAAASFDADAKLLALRPRWLDAIAAHDAALDLHTPIEEAYFAAVPAWPSVDHPAYWEETARVARLRTEAAEVIGVRNSEALSVAALDAFSTIVAEIAATPARTLAGLRFKVEASANEDHGHMELVDSVMADIAAFTAAHPTMKV
jgi:hypothetical protein